MVVGAVSLLLVSDYDSQAQKIIPWRNKHQLKVLLHCDLPGCWSSCLGLSLRRCACLVALTAVQNSSGIVL